MENQLSMSLGGPGQGPVKGAPEKRMPKRENGKHRDTRAAERGSVRNNLTTLQHQPAAGASDDASSKDPSPITTPDKFPEGRELFEWLLKWISHERYSKAKGSVAGGFLGSLQSI